MWGLNHNWTKDNGILVVHPHIQSIQDQETNNLACVKGLYTSRDPKWQTNSQYKSKNSQVKKEVGGEPTAKKKKTTSDIESHW